MTSNVILDKIGIITVKTRTILEEMVRIRDQTQDIAIIVVICLKADTDAEFQVRFRLKKVQENRSSKFYIKLKQLFSFSFFSFFALDPSSAMKKCLLFGRLSLALFKLNEYLIGEATESRYSRTSTWAGIFCV